jgi:hypothetical protein
MVRSIGSISGFFHMARISCGVVIIRRHRVPAAARDAGAGGGKHSNRTTY